MNQQQEEAGEPVYPNPRNLAAGTLKSLDTAFVAARRLEIALYGLGYCEPQVVSSQTEYHAQLKAWGMPVVSAQHHSAASNFLLPTPAASATNAYTAHAH